MISQHAWGLFFLVLHLGDVVGREVALVLAKGAVGPLALDLDDINLVASPD